MTSSSTGEISGRSLEGIQAIRAARGKFIAMAATYSLGVFNDNFFKQSACLMALAAGRTQFQGYASALFTVPFILFAAPAGWLSDRFPKRTIVIACKTLECLAMLCGAFGIIYGNYALILVMVGMMGIHSTLFSPALNGSIPELYPPDYVLRANSVLKMVTTAAILLGFIFAGSALAIPGTFAGKFALGRGVVGLSVLVVALLGLVTSLAIPRQPAAAPSAPFPWWGPVDTCRVLWNLRTDRLLVVAVVADGVVWLIATLQVLAINKMGMLQLHLGESATSHLVVAELCGLAVGGGLCSVAASGARWFRVLVPAGVLLTVAAGATSLLPWLTFASPSHVLFGTLFFAGMGGGLLLVPLESFIQSRPPPAKKGQTIAAANFTAFIGILCAGVGSVGLDRLPRASGAFGLIAVLTCGLTLWLASALKRCEVEHA